jgi:hypothetical protein
VSFTHDPKALCTPYFSHRVFEEIIYWKTKMIKWNWIDQGGVLQYFVTNPLQRARRFLPKGHIPWGCTLCLYINRISSAIKDIAVICLSQSRYHGVDYNSFAGFATIFLPLPLGPFPSCPRSHLFHHPLSSLPAPAPAPPSSHPLPSGRSPAPAGGGPSLPVPAPLFQFHPLPSIPLSLSLSSPTPLSLGVWVTEEGRELVATARLAWPARVARLRFSTSRTVGVRVPPRPLPNSRFCKYAASQESRARLLLAFPSEGPPRRGCTRHAAPGWWRRRRRRDTARGSAAGHGPLLAADGRHRSHAAEQQASVGAASAAAAAAAATGDHQHQLPRTGRGVGVGARRRLRRRDGGRWWRVVGRVQQPVAAGGDTGAHQDPVGDGRHLPRRDAQGPPVGGRLQVKGVSERPGRERERDGIQTHLQSGSRSTSLPPA